MTDDQEQTQSLSQLFKSISTAYDEISESELSSSDAKIQTKVKSAIAQCSTALNQIRALCLFSANESFDDLTTESIRFLTIPAFLGYFHSQIFEDRLEALTSAKVSNKL
ncbi:Immunoglobulin (CD79A) binding protein 1 [Cichlidogyrus casuarinus]|uniref:Immunoglobulin (CD79A) binding protein 1 n=1 Tax=Cichlidogyrus casuarinus TaxID=1844966 RepID=A0ABD2PZC6_9PLAT